MEQTTSAQQTPSSFDQIVKDSKPQDLPWFKKELEDLKPDARELFENYSKIPSQDVVSHIVAQRNKAFEIFPYPCLGQWGFLNLSVSRSPQYQEILQRIKDGEKYLDLGCCVGQDIRKLVYDGAPPENTFGSDLEGGFIDIGYDLFLDRTTLKTAFLTADIFDPESELSKLDGKVDIVHAASFFHLFDRDQQLQIAKRVIALLNPGFGSLVVGRQTGTLIAGEATKRKGSDKPIYMHNAESFIKFWEEAGNETGTKWEVEASLAEEDVGRKYSAAVQALLPPGMRSLTFTIRRL